MDCESLDNKSRLSREPNNYVIERDFQRDVFCMFGLPVDNLSKGTTKALLREKATMKENLVLSTININWIVRSFTDPVFRAAVLNSDFITLDGKPLVWLGRLLGLPMHETVAGSTLIQELRDEKGTKPLTIFMFGGDGEAAELAMERLKENKGGLLAVGAINPGFGGVEEMSTDRIINTINSASPDILLVALGAAKGVSWIEKNRCRLTAGFISHLGATVNFLAGTIRRAPKFMQEYGLEWVWRILQEPKMFSRYAGDGLVFGWKLFCLLPLWLRYCSWKRELVCELGEGVSGIMQEECEAGITITFGRRLCASLESPLRELLCRAALAGKDLTLDFQKTEYVHCCSLGVLLILQKHQLRQGHKLLIRNLRGRAAATFQLFGLDPMRVGGGI